MPLQAPVLSALALTVASGVHAAMGPAFSTGPVASDSFIREAIATLVLPAAPMNNAGDASLWVGMGTSNGDLIQSIADNSNSDSWSIYAYTLLSTGPATQTPVQGPAESAGAGDKITMHYKFDDESGNYTQIASINGKAVSELSTKDEHAQGWGSSVECAENNCGTMPAHSWEDVTLVMAKADPNYINTLGKGQGVTGDMVTNDNGKTWTVKEIKIPEYTFA